MNVSVTRRCKRWPFYLAILLIVAAIVCFSLGAAAGGSSDSGRRSGNDYSSYFGQNGRAPVSNAGSGSSSGSPPKGASGGDTTSTAGASGGPTSTTTTVPSTSTTDNSDASGNTAASATCSLFRTDQFSGYTDYDNRLNGIDCSNLRDAPGEAVALYNDKYWCKPYYDDLWYICDKVYRSDGTEFTEFCRQPDGSYPECTSSQLSHSANEAKSAREAGSADEAGSGNSGGEASRGGYFAAGALCALAGVYYLVSAVIDAVRSLLRIELLLRLGPACTCNLITCLRT